LTNISADMANAFRNASPAPAPAASMILCFMAHAAREQARPDQDLDCDERKQGTQREIDSKLNRVRTAR
jgi:hypothetical protein